MNNKIVLSSLSMDLKRVALGLHRNSDKVAKRFLQEALKRKEELDQNNFPLYIKSLLKRIKEGITDEEALMYSTLLQNYVLKAYET